MKAFRKLFLLALVLVILLAAVIGVQVPLSYASPDPDWLSGWSYRKSHVIENATGAGTNYQMKITCHYGSGSDSDGDVYLNFHSRTDFGDVRFTDNDETALLDYWMESKVDSDNAVFWVEVANDSSSQNQTIYVYYGKSDATNIGNGDNTFLFFDHFLGSGLNNSKWTEYGNGTASVANSEVTVTPASGSSKYIGSSNNFGVNSRFIGKGKLQASWWGSNEFGFCKIPRDVPTYIVYKYIEANFMYEAESTAISSGLTKDSNYHTFEVMRIDSSTIKFKIDGDYSQSASGTFSTESIWVMVFGYYGSYGKIVADYVFVTKYVDPEPSHGSWGSEESVYPQYTLAVYSLPTGVTFIINGVSHTTPWSGTYNEGTSVSLVMPETHDGYVWSHWLEDGDTNRTKTFVLTGDTIWTGVFTILGDINGDGIVDIFDIVTWAKAFGSKPEDPNWNPLADLNQDGTIDIFDAVTIGVNFGKIR